MVVHVYRVQVHQDACPHARTGPGVFPCVQTLSNSCIQADACFRHKATA